jgi:hypothetical protein
MQLRQKLKATCSLFLLNTSPTPVTLLDKDVKWKDEATFYQLAEINYGQSE